MKDSEEGHPLVHAVSKQTPKPKVHTPVPTAKPDVDGELIKYVLDLELDPYKWPMTLMWLNGRERAVDNTCTMMGYGVIPWRIDIHTLLETALGISLPFVRR